MSNNILITGVSGFIGFHLTLKLLESGFSVVGIDNMNDYYEVSLKKARLNEIYRLSKKKGTNFNFKKFDIKNPIKVKEVFKKYKPEIVFHLAAQAGVRYSILNPKSYVDSNLIGFANILESCRDYSTKNLIYASSSSVYGGNSKIPFSEEDQVDNPLNLYAASKKANELMAHSYSNLYGIPCTGIRFFTVYGPWGRPDMAPMIFTKSIISKKPIKIFNDGEMYRDFTYIDDVINILLKLKDKPAIPDINFFENDPNPSLSWCPHMIFNLGRGQSIKLTDFVDILEEELQIKCIREYLPLQDGDAKATWADTSKIQKWLGLKPNINLKDGLKDFVDWYKNYYL